MSRTVRTLFRSLAGVLLAAAAVHVAIVVPRVVALVAAVPRGGWAIAAGYAVSAATALVACGLGFLLLWKAPDQPAARALTLFLAFLALFWGSLFRFIEATGEGDSVSVSLSLGDGFVAQAMLVSFMLAIAAFASFSTLFPTPLTAERLPPAKRLRRLRALRAALLRPRVLWTVALATVGLVQWGGAVLGRVLGDPVTPDGTLRIVGLLPIAGGILLFLLLPPIALAFGARNLWTSFRLADPAERGRILWVVAGFNAATWMILGAIGLLAIAALLDFSLSAVGIAIPIAVFLAPLVAVVCAAVGVLRSGAIDAGLALQRSTVWGALGVLGVVGFAGLENALSGWIEGHLALPGFIGSMAAGAVVTAALLPFRRPLQRLVTERLRRRLTVDAEPSAASRAAAGTRDAPDPYIGAEASRRDGPGPGDHEPSDRKAGKAERFGVEGGA
jgi:hypothetical protein